MEYGISPLARTRRVVGRAFPLASFSVEEPEAEQYDKLLLSYRHVSPDDVFVIATHGETRSAVWGQLLSIAARARGATGAVTDGLVRDVEEIAAVGFPVFARGVSPLDSAGRQAVTFFGEPVTCGGVLVHPGDVVFGDAMGVVVVPRALAEETVRLAEEKKRGEQAVRAELERGEDVAEVFARHGIL